MFTTGVVEHLGGSVSFMTKGGAVGHMLFIHYISKSSGPPSILFDQSLSSHEDYYQFHAKFTRITKFERKMGKRNRNELRLCSQALS